MIKKIQAYFAELLPGGVSYIKQSTVAKNATSLYIIQFSTIILPLITIPYVVRVLGPANFGIIGFCQGLIAYFALMVDYGFGLSSTRDIAVNQGNKEKINHIFTATIVAKLVILAIGLIVLASLAVFVPMIKERILFMLVAYMGILGNVLFPVWLYQGYEKMQFLTVSSLISNGIMVVLVFLLVKADNGILIYLAIISFTQVINGLICLVRALFEFKVKIAKISINDIAFCLKDSWALFLSNASGSLYMAGNSFILGLFVAPTLVGYYSGAEKIIKGILSLLSPICQAIYPMFSKLVVQSKERFFYLTERLLVLMGLIGLAMTIGSLVFAPLLVKILLGSNFIPSVFLVRMMSPIPIFVSLSFILGGQILIPLKKDKEYAWSLFLGGIVNVVFVLLLAKKLGPDASAIGLLLAEISVVSLMFYYFLKSKKTMMELKLNKGN